MLQSLRIRNFALLEEVSLEFEPGFTAVTGETGAGKSILLGALSLLAGERVDKAIIRQGAPSCEVEAALHFSRPVAINAVLEELNLPHCEEGMLLLKRSVSVEKAPRITVNGSLATLAALQRLGGEWIDFHGPGEPRRLLKESCQLELLDLFGKAGAALEKYQENYAAWRSLIAERERIAKEGKLSPAQMDFMRNELRELDTLDLSAEAIAALERDHQRMSRAQEIIELASRLSGGLAGEEGVQVQLSALLREARQLEAADPASKVLADRLASVAVELGDLGSEFTSLAQELQVDGDEGQSLDERMNAWLDARRKHGGDAASVLIAREEMRRRLETQGDVEGSLARLEGEIQTALSAVKKEAKTLRAAREKTSLELGKATERNLAQLGFKKTSFEARIVALPEPTPTGDSGCQFLFSPNVGEPPLPLNRIASSGELARVMLALKSVLTAVDATALLVFDEVDANVGGEIGKVVGEKMAAIGKTHQVLCVTHLPQVAAQAAHHLLVTKDQSGARAVVEIAPIQASRKARVAELARMLGDRNAKSALAHAEELLKG